MLKHIVGERGTEKDYLHVQWHGLGFQSYGTEDSVHFPQRLDFDFLGPKASLEGFPGKGLSEHFECVQNQISASSSVKRTWPDHIEVSQ
jgi:hypothetical protein